ncbi:MAG: TraR/DksA C4-type zinc finger protein, partial [Planctomycetales bacterium]|nr:TraR/DksA C4-type zinc finger protein [Planctomycetales bacterium]
LLLVLRARLRGDVSSLANSALSKGPGGSDAGRNPADIADLGNNMLEENNSLLLMDNEEVVLAQIEEALERINEGTYGACTECGGRIPKLRLNALPYTPYCVKCASNNESTRRS